MTEQTTCDCGNPAVGRTTDGAPICAECATQLERKTLETADFGRVPVAWYATEDGLSNWLGTVEIPCYWHTGRHNIAKVRYDAHFNFAGRHFRATVYGDGMTLAHVYRVRKASIRNLGDIYAGRLALPTPASRAAYERATI